MASLDAGSALWASSADDVMAMIQAKTAENERMRAAQSEINSRIEQAHAQQQGMPAPPAVGRANSTSALSAAAPTGLVSREPAPRAADDDALLHEIPESFLRFMNDPSQGDATDEPPPRLAQHAIGAAPPAHMHNSTGVDYSADAHAAALPRSLAGLSLSADDANRGTSPFHLPGMINGQPVATPGLPPGLAMPPGLAATQSAAAADAAVSAEHAASSLRFGAPAFNPAAPACGAGEGFSAVALSYDAPAAAPPRGAPLFPGVPPISVGQSQSDATLPSLSPLQPLPHSASSPSDLAFAPCGAGGRPASSSFPASPSINRPSGPADPFGYNAPPPPPPSLPPSLQGPGAVLPQSSALQPPYGLTGAGAALGGAHGTSGSAQMLAASGGLGGGGSAALPGGGAVPPAFPCAAPPLPPAPPSFPGGAMGGLGGCYGGAASFCDPAGYGAAPLTTLCGGADPMFGGAQGAHGAQGGQQGIPQLGAGWRGNPPPPPPPSGQLGGMPPLPRQSMLPNSVMPGLMGAANAGALAPPFSGRDSPVSSMGHGMGAMGQGMGAMGHGMGAMGHGMGEVPAVGEAATREQVMQMQQLMMKLTMVQPSKHELRKLLQGLLAQERVAEAHVLLTMMRQAAMPVDVVMYNLLMTAFKKRRQWQSAHQVMVAMQQSGLQPDAVSYNILIDACGKAQQLGRAFEFHQQMRQAGLQPGVNTYTSLIDACGKCNQLARAHELLEQMQTEGVKPNAHTFTTIINACTQANDLDRGLQVLGQMMSCGAVQDLGHSGAVTPYTTLIRACGKVLAVDKAFRVLRCMLDAGVKPNVVTFNCLIDCCGKASEIDKAFQVLRLMYHYDSPPDTITFAALIDVCCKALDIDRAFQLLLQMRQQLGQKPNASTFTAVLEACARACKVDQGFEMLQMMGAAGVRPNTGSFNLLMEACGKIGRPDQAFEVHAYMSRIGVRPSGATYSVLVELACQAGNLQHAMGALHEMLAAGEQTDGSSLAAVIELCARQGQLEPAFQVFEYMQRLRVPPTAATYATLVSACLKCGNTARAQEAVQQMKAAGWVPDTNTYDALLLGCARHGEPMATLQAQLRQMQQEGVPRAAAVYLQLVEELATAGRHPDAVEMMETLRASGLQPGAPAVLHALRAVQPAEGGAMTEPTRRLLQLLQDLAANQPEAQGAPPSADNNKHVPAYAGLPAPPQVSAAPSATPLFGVAGAAPPPSFDSPDDVKTADALLRLAAPDLDSFSNPEALIPSSLPI